MAKRTCSVEGCDQLAHGRGLCFEHYDRARKDKALPTQWIPEQVCVVCGSKYTPKQLRPTKYCSDLCTGRSRTRSRLGQIYKQTHACKRCSKNFPASSSGQTYCGPCGRICVRCGATHERKRKRGLSTCDGCKLKTRRRQDHYRRARRARAAFEMFDAIEIYERDAWRCHLCGLRVARTKKAPHHKAPVLDHIIPIARGGGHLRVNVACAHYLCNQQKSDRPAGEQLRLVG